MISITLSHYTCELPLGCFLAPVHNNATWYASYEKTQIYHFLEDNNLESFSLPPNSRRTWRPTHLRDYSPPADVRRSDLKLVSVLVSPDNDSVKLHSVALQSASNISFVPTVLDVLCAGPNPNLWDNFTYDVDGWWITDTLLDGTLRMVSNSSHMQKRHKGVCSDFFVLYYSRVGVFCGWVRLQKVSDNYCGELLGAISFLSILHATLAHPIIKA